MADDAAHFWLALEAGDQNTVQLLLQQNPEFLALHHPETNLPPLMHIAGLAVPTDEHIANAITPLLNNENENGAIVGTQFFNILSQHEVNSAVHRFRTLSAGLHYTTPLHYAAAVVAVSNEQDLWLKSMMEILVDSHGADMHLHDAHDMLPLDYLHDQGPEGPDNHFIVRRVEYIHEVMNVPPSSTEGEVESAESAVHP